MKALTDAERALAAGDELAALDALLVAWRATRAPQLAELVAALGERLEDGLAPPFTGTRETHHDVWMAICRERRAVDWPLLLRSIVLTADRFGVAVVKALVERVQAIAAWAPDPRTTAIAIELLRRPGYESSSSSTYPFWTALCDLLVAHGDPRAADQLAALAYKQIFRPYSDRKKATAWFLVQQAATLARLRALPAATPLTAVDATACARLAKAIAKRGPLDAVLRTKLARVPVTAKARPAGKRAAPAQRDREVMDRHLEAAADAAEAGDDLRALDELLAAWRAARSTRIAELVDSVGRRLVGHQAVLEDGKRAEVQAAWLAIAKRRRAVDLPLLVANITNTQWRSTDALVRVKALAKWPPDPRTGVIAAELIGSPAFHASSTKPFWSELFALAIDHGDARTLAAFEVLRGTFAKRLGPTWTDRSAIARWFDAQVEAACATLRAMPAAIEPEPAICARIADALGTSPVDRLYAEIAANPDDDGLRAVLGDLLQQKGDPRGELIALQLAGKEPERAARLVARHARAWLGGVADHVVVERCTFERGFLAEATLATNAGDADALADDPVWATVRRLYVGDMGRLPDTLLRAMRLELLAGLPRKLFTQLLAWPTIPYRALGTTFWWQARDVEALTREREKLAQLRALVLLDQAERRWSWSGWLAKQLEEITFVDIVSWADLLGELREANTPRIHAVDGQLRLELEPGGAGELVATARMPPLAVNQLLSTIGPGTLTQLRVARPEVKAQLRTLEAHARRIGIALDLVSPP